MTTVPVEPEDVRLFIVAAENLLYMSMFHYWQEGGDLPDATDDDRAVWATIQDAMAAFDRMGLEYTSYEDYRGQLEENLRMDQSPQEQKDYQKALSPETWVDWEVKYGHRERHPRGAHQQP
jgi:hypothetical protein